jgi:putative IMPACT (imprinted ancient) family translation regulator
LKSISGEYTKIICKNKSKFIAFVKGIRSTDEAEYFISEKKREYSNANHIVYAYVTDNNKKKYDNDGEPHGTSGDLLLKVINENCFFLLLSLLYVILAVFC